MRPNQNGRRVITHDHGGFHGDVVGECEVGATVHLDQAEDKGVVGGGRLQLGDGPCKQEKVWVNDCIKKVQKLRTYTRLSYSCSKSQFNNLGEIIMISKCCSVGDLLHLMFNSSNKTSKLNRDRTNKSKSNIGSLNTCVEHCVIVVLCRIE